MKLKTSEFDTETTGLNPETCKILSLGFIHNILNLDIDKNDIMKVTKDEEERFYTLINWRLLEDGSFHNFSIPQVTIDIHGITDNEMIKNGIHPLLAFNNLYESLKNFENIDNQKFDIICAFNLPFDVNMMRSNLIFLLDYYSKVKIENNEIKFNGNTYDLTLLTNNIKDLLSIFTKKTKEDGLRRIVDENKENSNIYFIDSLIIDRIFHFMDDDFNKIHHNLEDVGLRYGLGKNQDAHNAMGDTIRLVDVLQKQIEECYNNHGGLLVNTQEFENRLLNKYINDSKRFDKEQLDYFGEKWG